MKKPWYQAGLQFECTECGGCCSGEPGYVWVNDQEISAMAQELSLAEAEFRERFVRRVGSRFSLVEYPDGDCIFLDPESRKCMVYQSRPIQCRTWPFWQSNLQSEKAWEETCKICPGSGTGKLYNLQQIETARKQRKV